MRKPKNTLKAKKAAKTRAKNARFRAGLAATRLEKEISEKTLIEKRAKAYRDMEPHLRSGTGGRAGHARF
jgi:hypothetical protein